MSLYDGGKDDVLDEDLPDEVKAAIAAAERGKMSVQPNAAKVTLTSKAPALDGKTTSPCGHDDLPEGPVINPLAHEQSK